MNFNELLQEIDIELSEYQLKQFNDYYHFLVEYNEKVNLTAITDEDGVILKHFVDSVAVIPYISEGASVVDVGCGGGFPCLPVAILRPDIKILGGEVESVVNYTLSDGGEELSRTIIIIKKATHTPPKYPRNNSQIAKRRL